MKVYNAANPVDFECRLQGGQGTHFGVPSKVRIVDFGGWKGFELHQHLHVLFSEQVRPTDTVMSGSLANIGDNIPVGD